MASAAQKAHVEKMNKRRAELRAQRAKAEGEEIDRKLGRASAPVSRKSPPTLRQKAEDVVERVRRLREEAAQLESQIDGDDPAAVVARARAKRRDPTVRRVEVQRDPVTGRVMAMGRDGKMVTRRVTNTEDKFHIDLADIPEGWSYQWIAMEIVGAEQRHSLASFKMGGWEPVTMDRYPGRYGPSHINGKLNTTHIAIDGLGLYERPRELTEEARGEEIAAARNLIRTRNEQFTPKLPDARSSRLRGTGLQARRSIEGMPADIGRPAYEVDVDAGLV